MLLFKLRHFFNWSQFKSDSGLELSSASASISSSAFSLSRIVDILAHGLIRNGMGHICNFIKDVHRAYEYFVFVALKVTCGK